MFFKIKCKIIKIYNYDLFVEIIDNDDLIKFQNNLIKLFSKKKDYQKKFNYDNKIFKLKYNKNTIFNINYSYSNITDLIGLELNINGYSKYYSFNYNDEVLNINTNVLETIKKNKNGYILYISKIKT